MLRTTIVGSWPPNPRYHGRLAAYRRGALSVHAAEALLVEMAATAIAQQQACGLTRYTGGETAADTFILHFPHWLTGIVPSARTDAWAGRGTYQIVDTLDAPHGLGIAAAFRRERAIDPAPSSRRDQPPGQRQPDPVPLPTVRDDGRILRPVGAALAIEAHHRENRVGLRRIERDEREPIDAVEVGEIARPLRRQFRQEAEETQIDRLVAEGAVEPLERAAIPGSDRPEGDRRAIRQRDRSCIVAGRCGRRYC